MKKFDCSEQAQRRRCDRVVAFLTDIMLDGVSHCGQWTLSHQLALREQVYYAQILLRSGQPEAAYRANRILEKVELRYHEFVPMILLMILGSSEALLENAVHSKIDAYLEEHIPAFQGEEMEFVGVNDNYPCMGVYTLVIGGQYLGKPELVAFGKERLSHFCQLLTRRGVASEYNSRTYTPIQLLCMAELVNRAEDPDIRQMALQCEHRLWADVMAHMHPGTVRPAGPYSRAYTDSSGGYVDLDCGPLYVLLGEALPANLLEQLEEGENGYGCFHDGLLQEELAVFWTLDAVYHCPQNLLELGFEKKLPFETWASTEFTSSTDMAAGAYRPENHPLTNYEYAAGSGMIYSYINEDYAMGTATHEFHNGIQTDSFHLLYRRAVPVTAQRDIGTVYARYLISDQYPITSGMIQDRGRKIGIQCKNFALQLYKAKPMYGNGVTNLRLSLIMARPDEKVEQVWLGDKKLEGERLTSEVPCPVFIQDGPVYMAFHPLLLTDHGRDFAVEAKWINGHMQISFYNYMGPARDFTVEEMLLTANGFVAQVGTAAEFGSFAEFRRSAMELQVHDGWQKTVHSRFTSLRKTSVQWQGNRIDCEYSPASEGIKCITVNGLPLPQDRLFISGFDCSQLPFLK